MKSQSILAILAHPDDEVLGPGGTLAHYAAGGYRVELVCATRGEAGEIAEASLATRQNLALVREQELRCSAAALGISQVTLLDYRDSGMEGTPDNDHPRAFVNATQESVLPQLVKVIRHLQPSIIITFEPYGGYGHPDHIAINRHTLAAFEAAAESGYRADLGPPWKVARLFYEMLPLSLFLELKRRMEEQGMDVSFFDRFNERRQNSWPADQIHCVMDVSSTIDAKWSALRCHRTQFGEDNLFRRLPESDLKEIFSREYFAQACPEPPASLKLVSLLQGIGDG